MTLPVSGAISASQINVELSRASGAAFSLDGTPERGLAGVSSGAISFSSFHGKSSIIRESAQGDYFTSGYTSWLKIIYSGHAYNGRVYWFGTQILEVSSSSATQFDYGGWRYFRGSFQYATDGADWDEYYHFYAVYRIKL